MRRYVPILAILGVGLAAFFLLVGPIALNPFRVDWIDSGDRFQHFSGWMLYRQGPWTFPIGLSPHYGMTEHSSIVFTDSIPILAIFFKAISFILPETFQYLGIWMLTCFILQAFFSFKLLGLWTNTTALQLVGAALFLISPPLLQRLGDNTALGSHFLILAAFYLFLRPSRTSDFKFWLCLLLLGALTNFYLLTMLTALWLAYLIQYKCADKSFTWSVLLMQLLVTCTCLLLVCWQAGYFAMGADIGGSSFHIGSVNMLGIFDSHGWSYLLPEIGDIGIDGGRYVNSGRVHESFAYLGLGILLLLALDLAMCCKAKVGISSNFHKYWALVLAVLLMAIFSLSNDLRIGPWFEWYIPLPQSWYEFLTTWRSPARLIWPAYYLLMLWTIVFVIKHFKNKQALILLSLCFVIQVIDTSAGWKPKRHDLLMRSEISTIEMRNSVFWEAVSSHYQKLIRVAPGKDWSWMTSVRYAVAEHLQTNDVYFARESERLYTEKRKQLFQNIAAGIFDPKGIYLINDEHVSLIQLHMNPELDLLARVDDLIFFAPNWRSCDKCRAVDHLTLLASTPFRPRLSEKMAIVKNNPNSGVLLWGWYPPEIWGAWSNGAEAAIDLPLPAIWNQKKPLVLTLEVDAAVSSLHPVQVVHIDIEGLDSHQFRLTSREKNLIQIILPPSLHLANDLKMVMHFANVTTPAKLGIDIMDNRNIAIGITSYSYKQ